MSYESLISAKEPVFGPGMSAPSAFREERSKGYESRDWTVNPFGSVATPFTLPIIPRAEWEDRVRQFEDSGMRLSDVIRAAGIGPYNQANTNYCWANAPCKALEVIRALQNEPHVDLSPASVAAPIKKYRNQGGWGSEALEYLVKYGAAPQSLWPPNAIAKQYDTADSQTERKKYRVVDWFDLRPRDFDQMATCLLHRWPVSVGYDWWRHQVLAVDLVIVDGVWGCRILNSWDRDWGDEGSGILLANKAVADEAQVPHVAIAA